MRRGASGLLAVVLLAACGASGAERPGCGADRTEDVQLVVTQRGGTNPMPVPIDCMHDVGPRRLRVGFTFPPGPSCHHLSRIDVHETADAVALTVIVAVDDDPAAGACPEEPQLAVTELDLAARVEGRVLLDASEPAEDQ